jgi:uncharacterized protein (TIGR02145 family)
MKSRKIISILILIIICLFLYRCKTEEIILHGEISGIVTDTTTSQPLQAVAVKLNPVNDTTSTGSDGKYLFKSLIPGDYEIQTSKLKYRTASKFIEVLSAKTQEVNFTLNKVPVPHYSKTVLDFGLDSTSLLFTISNISIGMIQYMITPSDNWITVSPSFGYLTNEADSIIVTINRTSLSENIHSGTITILSVNGEEITRDKIGIYLNGVMDEDGNYYKVVKIGTQTWMAENLNVGKSINNNIEQKDNGFIEKYYYGNDTSKCKIYGGLYSWAESMQYNPPDLGKIGTTQGVCPDGWHIPSGSEWGLLREYCGGYQIAGENLKETGTMEEGTGYWRFPNFGADNDSGFSARPGGACRSGEIPPYKWLGEKGLWWISDGIFAYSLVYDSREAPQGSPVYDDSTYACSVRCVKDPPKNK